MTKPGKAKRKLEQERPPKVEETAKADTPPDVSSVRAKSSGHGKVTADKWNQ